MSEQRGQQDASPETRVPQSAEEPRTGMSPTNISQPSAFETNSSPTNTSQPQASDPRTATPRTTTPGTTTPGATTPGATKPGPKNEAVLGHFTIRDLTVFASTLILFVASLIPMFAGRYNLWNMGSLFFLGLGVILPLIVTALFVARRLTPGSKVRIGSLSVDQFASVAASFALAFFFLAIAGDFAPSLLVGLIGSVGLFAATVLARFIPYFAGDFLDRREEPAHVVARNPRLPYGSRMWPKHPRPPGNQSRPKKRWLKSCPAGDLARRRTPRQRGRQLPALQRPAQRLPADRQQADKVWLPRLTRLPRNRPRRPPSCLPPQRRRPGRRRCPPPAPPLVQQPFPDPQRPRPRRR
ncbi:hypothetical protein ACW0JT_08435 [Arthrobacter sp. SA17]